MSNAGRQKVIAKLKSHSQKELHAKRRKENYAQMEPAMKKKVLSDRAIWYSKSLVLQKKKSFRPNQQIGTNHLVL